MYLPAGVAIPEKRFRLLIFFAGKGKEFKRVGFFLAGGMRIG
jgi:hypothetical protein